MGDVQAKSVIFIQVEDYRRISGAVQASVPRMSLMWVTGSAVVKRASPTSVILAAMTQALAQVLLGTLLLNAADARPLQKDPQRLQNRWVHQKRFNVAHLCCREPEGYWDF